MIPPINLGSIEWAFRDAKPFPFVVIDGFFTDAFARELAAEFPDFQRKTSWQYNRYHRYQSALEDKYVCNAWDAFGPASYRAFTFLNSPGFVELLRLSVRMDGPLYADPGLHGGGFHGHARLGCLNPHLDYARHAKTGLARHLNILVYLNPDWQEDWGGHLGLYDANPVQLGPGELRERIAPAFNRAVIFQTPGAWHGLCEPITCPEGQMRKSLATYYLTEPNAQTEQRTRALFAPSPEQAGDAEVLELIRRRSDESTAASAYRA